MRSARCTSPRLLVRLTGRELVSLLSHAMSYISADIESRDGGIPCGSGFSYAMDLPGGSASDVRIRLSDGTYAPADPAAVYDVLVPDYIMRGKDGYDALAEKKPVSDFGIDDFQELRSSARRTADAAAPERGRTLRNMSYDIIRSESHRTSLPFMIVSWRK